jgi:hypothetical protein
MTRLLWAREAKDKQGERGGLKESLRWIEGYERIAEAASSLPHTRLVYVADREADMIALTVRAQQLGTPADWLIRSTHDRAHYLKERSCGAQRAKASRSAR